MTMAQLVLLSRAEAEAHENAGKPQAEEGNVGDLLMFATAKVT